MKQATQAQPAKKPEIPNSFMPVLNELQNGHCVGELSEGLAELIASAKLNNTSGSICLTISVKPTNGGETMLLTPKVKVTMPKTPERTTMFYTNDEGGLQRTDPNQREMEFRTLPTEDRGPIRTLDSQAAV